MPEGPGAIRFLLTMTALAPAACSSGAGNAATNAAPANPVQAANDSGQAGDPDDWEAQDLALTPAIAPIARIHCASGQCPAGARHNGDGTTTVAVSLPGGRTRAILFSAGGNNVIGANEHGDVGGEWTGHGWTVTLGAERYEIPESLVTGH